MGEGGGNCRKARLSPFRHAAILCKAARLYARLTWTGGVGSLIVAVTSSSLIV